MKKVILFAALVAAFSATSSAQVAFGPEVGFTISSMKVDDTSSVTDISKSASLGSIKAGFIVDLGLTKKLSLQPGIFYTVKGGESNMATKTIIGTISVPVLTVVNYIEVPVNIQYQIVDVKMVKVFAGAGPYFAMALSGKTKTAGVESDLKIGTAATDFIKASDLGVNINAGALLKFGLFARLQYGMGLTNVASQPDAMTVKNGTFCVSVGYLFGRTR